MKVLHITSHLGGGLGSVIIDFLKARSSDTLVSLDTINRWAKDQLYKNKTTYEEHVYPDYLKDYWIPMADIVLVHWYDHPLLIQHILTSDLPPCRLIFWCHKNTHYSSAVKTFPDMWINTSPVQGPKKYIWSTRDMRPFQAIKKVAHEGFNVGYIGTVDYKKMHPLFFDLCSQIKIPDVHFYVIGENKTIDEDRPNFTFTGKVDDIKPYLAKMDLFGYPLHPNHYGTCEQVIGEAMCAGVPPVTLNNSAERYIIDSSFNGFRASLNMYPKVIENLANQPVIRNWMGGNAKDIAHSVYNHKFMLQEWDKVFNEIMDQPKRKREFK